MKHRLVLSLAPLTLIFSLTIISCNEQPEKLPYLGQREPVEKVVDGKTTIDTVYQEITPFKYLNQDSVIITDQDFNGKIYVADFFFTACNTICPVMHRNMLNVYNKFKDNSDVKFLSHSIDTKYDTPARLKSYAEKLGMTGNKWEFVHGSADSIYKVAARDYMVTAYEDKKDPQGYVHQGWFILVDKDKHIRGAYDGTQKDQVDQLMQDMELLLKEQ